MATGGDPFDRLVPIGFAAAELDDLAADERREWWIANGRGGYAGGTVALSLTRRYHGLLIAPIDPPLGRVLVLTKADATLRLGAERYPLFTNRWGGGAVDPQGYRLLESFHLDGTIPVWRFRCGSVLVEHRIWMEPGADTVCVACPYCMTMFVDGLKDVKAENVKVRDVAEVMAEALLR